MPKARGPVLYPYRFKEIYKDKIWGGPELRKVLRKKGAGAKTGESWEISGRDKQVSIIAAGPLKGWTLDRLCHEWPREVLGDEHSMRFASRFPLLVKFIGAHERLSLQVHPSDDFAQRYETEPVGKMEAWYVVHAPKEARVIRGVLPGTTVSEFRLHLKNGTVEQCLNAMEVKPGDVIFIPPGTIHTAFGGAIFLEVQQNSDVTYRLTDWGRMQNGKPRALDVEKAMNVTDFYSMGVSKYKPSRMPGFSYRRMLLIKCEKFTMEAMQLERKRIKERTNRARFQILTCTFGKGVFHYGDKLKSRTPFSTGETFLLPAHLGEYEVASSASSELVVTYVE
ncbi:MAG TPA: type I phosphomannose isomerase catalytic subunit [Planctomycetota bacterium]|nr:type I phosphomannose isomerase catalytic subunit [Planctomycetota bacterium]